MTDKERIADLEARLEEARKALREIDMMTRTHSGRLSGQKSLINNTASNAIARLGQPSPVSALREKVAQTERALLDFYIHSRQTGHGCPEPERPCRYCYYGRMRSKKDGDRMIDDEHHALFNARGEALAALDAAFHDSKT